MTSKPLKTKEFLAEVVELVRMQLPAELRDVEVVGPMSSLVKLHYGDPKLHHYEVWVQRRTGQVEIGLHFEGPPESNANYLQGLLDVHPEAIASLGPGVEPEQWTGSWTRVHQHLPLTALDEDLLMVVSGRLAQMIRVLEPEVRDISSPSEATRAKDPGVSQPVNR